MFEVKRTDAFDGWLKELKDSKGRTKIQARIDRLANGNAGDVAPIGEGLSELRIDFGPGLPRVLRASRQDALPVAVRR